MFTLPVGTVFGIVIWEKGTVLSVKTKRSIDFKLTLLFEAIFVKVTDDVAVFKFENLYDENSLNVLRLSSPLPPSILSLFSVPQFIMSGPFPKYTAELSLVKVIVWLPSPPVNWVIALFVTIVK